MITHLSQLPCRLLERQLSLIEHLPQSLKMLASQNNLGLCRQVLNLLVSEVYERQDLRQWIYKVSLNDLLRNNVDEILKFVLRWISG
jgi:hypothetical protein